MGFFWYFFPDDFPGTYNDLNVRRENYDRCLFLLLRANSDMDIIVPSSWTQLKKYWVVERGGLVSKTRVEYIINAIESM